MQSRQLAYTEIHITTDELRKQEIIERSGGFTVPQISIDGDSIGGSDDLVSHNVSGKLDQRLERVSRFADREVFKKYGV